MEPFEDELRQWLKRREPSADFTGKVMARVVEHRRRPLAVRWLAIASLAASFLAGGYFWREQRAERARGEQARDQLVLAIEITNAKISTARQAVLETLRRN